MDIHLKILHNNVMIWGFVYFVWEGLPLHYYKVLLSFVLNFLYICFLGLHFNLLKI
jgi:hypothetical protein